ncbi:Uncharacterised protein [Vibrio cholerae]|nr:Uncharacterised protein [Vibrio cholerae]
MRNLCFLNLLLTKILNIFSYVSNGCIECRSILNAASDWGR